MLIRARTNRTTPGVSLRARTALLPGWALGSGIVGLVALRGRLSRCRRWASREQGWPRCRRALHRADLVLRGVCLNGVGSWGRDAWAQGAPACHPLGPRSGLSFCAERQGIVPLLMDSPGGFVCRPSWGGRRAKAGAWIWIVHHLLL